MEGYASKPLGFKIDWRINNPKKTVKKTFVTNDISGSVSSPGLGSQATVDYYKGTQEYTAVIELPSNITQIIGDGALVVDLKVLVPDVQHGNGVQLLTERWKQVVRRRTLDEGKWRR